MSAIDVLLIVVGVVGLFGWGYAFGAWRRRNRRPAIDTSSISRTVDNIRAALNEQTGSGDFSIGSGVWPGISKLTEEAGEVLQVCGKLIGTGGDVHHWDGSNLKARLEDEMADVMAACEFVASRNDLDAGRISRRVDEKIALFNRWHEEQTSAPCPKCGRVAVHAFGCPLSRCPTCGGTTEHANGCPEVKEQRGSGPCTCRIRGGAARCSVHGSVAGDSK